ncbi:MAG: Cof-type HAD-IIB family hydrolase [Ktedonobacteraceae bacterium]|nr:Cof-type HAD-IIB family hydrolase [Chloroflexota bacterium]
MTTLPESIKLLIIDIDGTLLNPEGQITPDTRAAVHAAQQAGIVVTLATARRYCNTKQVADELGLDIPLILYDGAQIVRHPQGQILYSRALPAQVAREAIDILVRHAVQPVVHPLTGLDEEIWTGPPELDSLWQEAYFTTYPEQMRRMPYDLLTTSQASILRVVGFASEEAVEKMTPQVAALDCSWNTIKRGSYGSAELAIMHAGCSKASGMLELARRLGIPLTQVMALGDNNNDIEMLQAAGWGVAMGQAPDAVKAAADVVTNNNTQDGVARAIERYALRRPASAASNSLNRVTCL